MDLAKKYGLMKGKEEGALNTNYIVSLEEFYMK